MYTQNMQTSHEYTVNEMNFTSKEILYFKTISYYLFFSNDMTCTYSHYNSSTFAVTCPLALVTGYYGVPGHKFNVSEQDDMRAKRSGSASEP